MRQDLLTLGEASVYPGHPITIAYLITKRYSSFEDATKKTGETYACVGDALIPGAGGEVYLALDFLKMYLEKGPVQAIQFARDSWAKSTSSVYRGRRESGDVQANRIIPLLHEQMKNWR